jgi:hypothetical protein
MAYKDLEKKKAAKKRYKEKWKYQIKAEKIAQRLFPIRQKCFVKGCQEIGERHHHDYDKPREITWVCRYHHMELFHKKRSIKIVKPKLCKVCKEVATSFGLCNKHYKVFKKIFDQEYAERVRKNRRDYYLKHESKLASATTQENQ